MHQGWILQRFRWQVFFSLCVWLCNLVSAQFDYTITEELRKGSVVGNLANDFGINAEEVSKRKLLIVSDVSEKYFSINKDNGNLYIADRIDREALCGAADDCDLTFDVVAENPLHVFNVKIKIKDINDNPPRFNQGRMLLQMSEHTLTGAKYILINAEDLDVGINSLKGYRLSENQHFLLKEQLDTDSMTFPELVLEKPLDRETQSNYDLILTAYDGGDPAQTGTTLIQITVTDFNDNTPVFTQKVYKAKIKESVAIDSIILQVSASDADEGVNAQVTYSLNTMSDNILQTFTIHPKNGEIKVKAHLDYEVTKYFEFSLAAKDEGGLSSNAKVLLEILDENDNAPEVLVTSLSSPVSEDIVPGTAVAMIAIRDKDSGENGEVQCQIVGDVPFKLVSSASNFYKIVTKDALDREQMPSYNISIHASDKGFPPMSSEKLIQIDLSDVNDNAPTFEKASYAVFVPENNLPGISIFSIQAKDIDREENSKVTYSVVGNEKGPISVYISINPTTGVIYAQKSFDYEQQREFNIQVIAKDNGFPSLNSSATVQIHILDQNDNPPVILYPADTDDPKFEMVPWSSEQGSLISKVVAVDADSGHNSWLSYFLQSSEPSVFAIDRQTGEIRTAHIFQEKDSLKYKVVIIVKDNGFPSLSASATLTMVLANNVHQLILEKENQSSKVESQSSLQVYLVIALALISFLFLVTVILAIISKYRESKYTSAFTSMSTNLYPTIDPRFIPHFNNGTLQLPYSYDVCVTLDSRERDFAFLRPQPNVPVDHLIDADDSEIGNESSKDSLLTQNQSQVCFSNNKNNFVN